MDKLKKKYCMTTFPLLPNLLTSLGILSIVFLFLLLNRNNVRSWTYFLHFSLAFIFIQLLYPLGDKLQVRWWPSLQYAWIAKLLSLAVVTGVYLIFMPALFGQFGWKVRFNGAYLRPTLLLSLVLILFKCITNYMDTTKEAVTLERWLYQISLPGLEEEIVFRGLFLVLFREMFKTDAVFLTKSVALDALLVTLVFALVHSFQIDGTWHVAFNPILFISSGFAGFVYMWLRMKHESLAPPIVCHNAVNTLITFVQWIK